MHILTLIKKIVTKILKLKLVIIWESQNMKTFFQKATFQTVPEKILLLKKLKLRCRRHI